MAIYLLATIDSFLIPFICVCVCVYFVWFGFLKLTTLQLATLLPPEKENSHRSIITATMTASADDSAVPTHRLPKLKLMILALCLTSITSTRQGHSSLSLNQKLKSLKNLNICFDIFAFQLTPTGIVPLAMREQERALFFAGL